MSPLMKGGMGICSFRYQMGIKIGIGLTELGGDMHGSEWSW